MVASSHTSPKSTPSGSMLLSLLRRNSINPSGSSSATSSRHEVIPILAYFSMTPPMNSMYEGVSSFTSGSVSKPHQQRYLSGYSVKSYQSRQGEWGLL